MGKAGGALRFDEDRGNGRLAGTEGVEPEAVNWMEGPNSNVTAIGSALIRQLEKNDVITHEMKGPGSSAGPMTSYASPDLGERSTICSSAPSA